MGDGGASSNGGGGGGGGIAPPGVHDGASSTDGGSPPPDPPLIVKLRPVLSVLKFAYVVAWAALALHVAYRVLWEAYEIRLYAIREYGRVIHEFDPYFNLRATEYLYHNGWGRFAHWFDYKVWYPLGRPVGTTIYPGMQVTSVFIKRSFDWIVANFSSVVASYGIKKGMSLNDVCCFVPAWFGSVATLFTGLMAYEATVGVSGAKVGEEAGGKGSPQAFRCLLSGMPLLGYVYAKAIVPTVNVVMKLLDAVFGGNNLGIDTRKPLPTLFGSSATSGSSPAVECGLFAAAIMSIVPAHIMRSVGGGYDNESVAMTAMTATFWLWMRSLRGDGDNTQSSMAWGATAGIAYFYMAAVWGGYVFVINLVGVHCALLILLGRHSSKLHRSYTLFYLIGTALATCVPVVGWTPLKSLEQMGPMAVFFGIQLVEYCEVKRKKEKLSFKEAWKLRIKVFGAAGLVAVALAAVIWPTGYFGPISARVRGLFVKHTKTGNPLVDSVAEHQPASAQAYTQYLSDVVYIAPVGLALVALFHVNDSSSFLLVYAAAAYFFSHKMVRLILLTGPIGSALAGVALGRVSGWAMAALLDFQPSFGDLVDPIAGGDEGEVAIEAEVANKKGGKKGKNKKKGDKADEEPVETQEKAPSSPPSVFSMLRSVLVRAARVGLFAYAVQEYAIPHAQAFYDMSHTVAKQMSHPTILFKANTRDGQTIIVDDYRDAYLWLRDNTPEDARIMAWWDYGYQITGIANRTTVADGNTWNHEHIALLGRALTSPEKEGHRIARHLADYVLVWAGGGGDDLAKSPHLARIANSIYRHMCPGDPTCRQFGFLQQGVPSPMMEASLLYKLHSHGQKPGVEADNNRFRHVHTSKYGKVRIYKILSVSKDSKEWVKKNRKCNVPGGWYCPGQYPPALQKIVKEGRNFAQLEDFNRGDSDEEYQKKYFDMLNNPDKAKRKAQKKMAQQERKKAAASGSDSYKADLDKMDPSQRIRVMNNRANWKDTELTSTMWSMIAESKLDLLEEVLEEEPAFGHVRSSDGRGPMFWAHEFGNKRVVDLLKKYGVSETERDAKGMTPLDMRKG